MQLVLKPNETVSVNQIIKRGSFPVNLRIKRIHNHDNLQAQFLPTEENDYRPYAGRCKNGKGKRLVMQKSMETDDVFEAAKRAVAWVEEIEKRGRDAKELKKGAAQSLVHYWNLYFDKEKKLRENQRNFVRWEREELLKWQAKDYGIAQQDFAKVRADRINRKDFEEYFDLLEIRARKNNGSNGSGIKGQQKTLIRKLLAIAESDFVGHSFPNFPKISKEYKQVKHLDHKMWDKLNRHVFELGEGKDAVCYSPEDYKALPFNNFNRKNIRNWIDVYDALNLQWYFYLRAEDMYRLKAEWFKQAEDGSFICDLETTKKDRPKHKTTHYRPDAVSFMKRLLQRKPSGYLIFPHLPRPVGNEAESSVLLTLNFLLKSAIVECLPDFPANDAKWTTIRHTAFRLTLEEDKSLGVPPEINAFADNGHTSADQLRNTYLKYIDLEASAQKSRKTIAPRKQVRWGGKFKSKRDVKSDDAA
tara:strand:+ start:756 stop:2174 length:1419 start_codon:yes stop_codon:yes gene_type:complete